MWEGPGPDPRVCVCVCGVILLSESHTETSEKEENNRSFRRKNICSLGGEKRLNHLVNKVPPDGDTGGHVE